VVELDEEFRRRFPNLSRELAGPGTLRIDAVRSSLEEAEKAAHTLKGYEPTVIDFIRRCETEEQALEIIDFMERRKEISRDYAERLRNQLLRLGVRSFGKQKKPGSYERGEIY
jgi:hypothetical protein